MRYLFIAFCLAATPTLAQDYPFVGQWDCQVATFTFDQQGYDNGSDTLPYLKVTDAGDDNWIIDFADGYQIGLSSVTADTMQWLSMASGDMFDCTALR